MNCPQCGKSTPFSTGSFCSYCGTLLNKPQTTAAVSTEDDRKQTGFSEVPWESALLRDAPLRALVQTFISIIFHPDRFYAAVTSRRTTSLFPALWFGLLTGSIGIIAAWLWSLVYSRYGWFSGEESFFFGASVISPSTLISTPLLLLIQYFIIAWYTRIALHFFKGKKAGTADIIRILCYAESASVLAFIPAAGYILSVTVGIYSILTGFHALFGISRKKVMFALVIPFIIVTGVVLVLITGGIVGGTIAGAGFLQQLLPQFR